jgi:hypothetical protein
MIEKITKEIDFKDKIVFDYNPQPVFIKHILPLVKKYVCMEKPNIYDLLSLTKKAEIIKELPVEKGVFDIVILYDDGIQKEISEYFLFLNSLLKLLSKKGIMVIVLVKSKITASLLMTFISQFIKKISYSKEGEEEIIICRK